MKSNEQTPTPLQAAAFRQKLMEAEIISRAWSDATFRAQLEVDPTKALAEAGIPLPEGKTIRILQEEPGTVRIFLPPKPETSVEASDDELASVAGGGLIDTGKCKHYEDAKKRDSDKFFAGVALACGALFGVSWGYG